MTGELTKNILLAGWKNCIFVKMNMTKWSAPRPRDTALCVASTSTTTQARTGQRWDVCFSVSLHSVPVIFFCLSSHSTLFQLFVFASVSLSYKLHFPHMKSTIYYSWAEKSNLAICIRRPLTPWTSSTRCLTLPVRLAILPFTHILQVIKFISTLKGPIPVTILSIHNFLMWFIFYSLHMPVILIMELYHLSCVIELVTILLNHQTLSPYQRKLK